MGKRRKKNVSIVIPAFNEEAAIGHVIKSIKLEFPECKIIAIDDGSSDATAKKAEGEGVLVLAAA